MLSSMIDEKRCGFVKINSILLHKSLKGKCHLCQSHKWNKVLPIIQYRTTSLHIIQYYYYVIYYILGFNHQHNNK
ncbi:hypothetical protein EB796_019098 [Bugula neritina]|uniref:Uncharacterized protein n=1 Tax=Bugula neritina TaxID=10212 RepID=A0A7J7J8M7_BUGNE|nr:hypothetical protein EB796_019098 [Bugula neritina]